MYPWERRLNDLWLLLERCHVTYMEPELFRLNTNQFLQTSRTVTFIIQKNKLLIPGFDVWYQSVVTSWVSDVVMSWAKDSRNKIEKEGDIDLHSTLEMTLFWSYLVEQDARISTGRAELLQAGTKKLVQLARQHLPPGVIDSSAVKIERRWVANALPDWELLQALTYVYTTLYRICQEISSLMGTRFEGAIPDPTALEPARELAKQTCYLKLSDLNFHYQHSKRTRIDPNFKPAEGMQGAIASLRESMSNADTIDEMFAALVSMAESTFTQDGYHLPMMFLYDKSMKIVDMVSMLYGDRTDKYIFWRNAADRMVAAKATLVATIGEAWIRDMKGHTYKERIDNLPIIGERLFVTALDDKGQFRSASWDIIRQEKETKPALKKITPEQDFSEKEVPFYYAPILRALGVPYPRHIADVLSASPEAASRMRPIPEPPPAEE